MTKTTEATARMPALYLGHGAPILVDDPIWPGELAAWATCWLSSWCRRVSGCWMCRPSSVRGSGCWLTGM